METPQVSRKSLLPLNWLQQLLNGQGQPVDERAPDDASDPTTQGGGQTSQMAQPVGLSDSQPAQTQSSVVSRVPRFLSQPDLSGGTNATPAPQPASPPLIDPSPQVNGVPRFLSTQTAPAAPPARSPATDLDIQSVYRRYAQSLGQGQQPGADQPTDGQAAQTAGSRFVSPQALSSFTSQPQTDTQSANSAQPQTDTPQSNPQSNDVSTVPVADRRNAILGAETSQAGQPAAVAGSSSPAASTASPRYLARQAAADARRAQLEAELTKLYGLENTKAVDTNGRLKSTFLGVLRGLLQGAATGNPYAALGGAAFGGIYGGVHPAYDEEMKQVAQINQQRGKVQQALSIDKELSQMDALEARGAGAQTPAQLSTARRGFANFLAKFYPEGYQRGTRADVDAELDRLQMSPPPALPKKAGAGKPMVATPGQGVLVSDGMGGYTFIAPHGADGQTAPTMTDAQKAQTEAERKRLEVSLAELNLRRAHAHLPPVSFDDYVAGGGDTPATDAGKVAPPATIQQPTSGGPQLRVQPGAQPEPVFGRGRRGNFSRGTYPRGSSGGQSKSDQIATTTALSSVRDVENLRSQAAAARSRGEDDVANQYDASADNIINSTAQARGGIIDVVTGADGRRSLRLKGAQSAAQQTTQPQPQTSGPASWIRNAATWGGGSQPQTQPASQSRQYTAAEIRANAIQNHLDPDAAVNFARQSGRLKRGN